VLIFRHGPFAFLHFWVKRLAPPLQALAVASRSNFRCNQFPVFAMVPAYCLEQGFVFIRRPGTAFPSARAIHRCWIWIFRLKAELL
jgi:hypothetical protein